MQNTKPTKTEEQFYFSQVYFFHVLLCFLQKMLIQTKVP